MAARAPAQRDAALGRELIGLYIDVPWSAWDGYPVGSGFETGIVWEYQAQPPGRFIISFDPDEDDHDDIGMTWAELMGEDAHPLQRRRRSAWRSVHGMRSAKLSWIRAIMVTASATASVRASARA